MLPGVKSATVLSTRLDDVNWHTLEQATLTLLEEKKYHYVVTLNGEIALLAQKYPDLKNAINNADLVIPDSANIVWAGRRSGLGLPERTPGSDYIFLLARLAAAHDLSLFLLGGRGDVAQKAALRLQDLYPKIKIAGTSSADPNDPAAIKSIIEVKPDIVIVAYGAPKQELWLANHQNLPCRIAVGLGGTFDMLSGIKPRAPRFFRRFALEWLWRLIIEPKRLPRIFRAVIVFPLKVIFTRPA